jgi:hypothetical protein
VGRSARRCQVCLWRGCLALGGSSGAARRLTTKTPNRSVVTKHDQPIHGLLRSRLGRQALSSGMPAATITPAGLLAGKMVGSSARNRIRSAANVAVTLGRDRASPRCSRSAPPHGRGCGDRVARDLGRRYPATVATWENIWERFIPFLAFPPGRLITQLDDAHGNAIRARLYISGITVTATKPAPARTFTATAHLDSTGAATYAFDIQWSIDPQPIGPVDAPRRGDQIPARTGRQRACRHHLDQPAVPATLARRPHPRRVRRRRRRCVPGHPQRRDLTRPPRG